MSYRIGQLRKNDFSNEKVLSSSISLSTTSLPYVNNFSDEHNSRNDFQDYCLWTGNDNKFAKGETYFFRFAIARIFGEYYRKYAKNSNTDLPNADIMDITLYLSNMTNVNENEDPPQEIGTFRLQNETIHIVDTLTPTTSFSRNGNIIKAYDFSDKLSYQIQSFVFTPDKDYNVIIFRIQRNIYDILESVNHKVRELGSTFDGRRWLLNDGLDTESEENEQGWRQLRNDGVGNEPFLINSSFSNNIILASSSLTINDNIYNFGCVKMSNVISENRTWLKIGYQSRPGSLVVINKEPIRVGSNGIYELNNGTSINSIMIPTITGLSEIDAFLLDYAYDESENEEEG